MTFNEAKRCYPHRFTMEHTPQWAGKVREDGTYYAPQYRTDREWFENTVFPPSHPLGPGETSCYSTGATWPLGQSLSSPYRDGERSEGGGLRP